MCGRFVTQLWWLENSNFRLPSRPWILITASLITMLDSFFSRHRRVWRDISTKRPNIYWLKIVFKPLLNSNLWSVYRQRYEATVFQSLLRLFSRVVYLCFIRKWPDVVQWTAGNHSEKWRWWRKLAKSKFVDELFLSVQLWMCLD